MLPTVTPATLLDWKIAQMGSLAEQELGWAVDALARPNAELGEQATASHTTIKRLGQELQDEVTVMIANRRSNADDLRQLVTVLKIAGDLERIGDLGRDVVRRALAVVDQDHFKSLMSSLRLMIEMAQAQLKDVLDGLVRHDVEKALAVWRKDQDIDAMHNSIFRELFTYMMEDPRNISICINLLLGAKSVERIGDHATNIAEQIYFAERGVPVTTDRPKRDDTSSILVLPETG
jgi:phosphate transport system protein